MRAYEIFESSEPNWGNASYSDFASFKAAIQKEWSLDIMNLERTMVKRTGSSYGVTLGISHFIDPKTKKVVAYWETTDADMVPGRGKVTRGYGQVAVPAKAKAPAKPKPIKIPNATKPATPEEISQAISELRSAMGKAGGSRASFRSSQSGFEVRYWGDWEVPPGEEDDGDYDWEVLTDESHALLDQTVKSVEARFPNVKFDVEASEKNWIYAHLSSKL